MLQLHQYISLFEGKLAQRHMRNRGVALCGPSPLHSDTQLLIVPSSDDKAPTAVRLLRYEAPEHEVDLQGRGHSVTVHDLDGSR